MRYRFFCCFVFAMNFNLTVNANTSSIGTSSNLLYFFESIEEHEWGMLAEEINKMNFSDFIWNGESDLNPEKQDLFNRAAHFLRKELNCSLTITTLIGNENFDGKNTNIAQENVGVIASQFGSGIYMFRSGNEIEEEELQKMEAASNVYIFSGHLGEGFNFYMRERAGRTNFVNYGSGPNGILILKIELFYDQDPVFTSKLFDDWVHSHTASQTNLFTRTIRSKGFYAGMILSMLLFVAGKRIFK